MRILHVIPGLTHERGGPSAVVQHLAEQQAMLGHQVTVLTTDQGLRHGERSVALAPNVHVCRTKVRGPDRLAYSPGLRKSLRDLLQNCDLVHAHSIFTYPIHVALREAHKAGTPVILRPCGQLHPYSLRHSRAIKWAYLSRWGSFLARAIAAWHHVSPQEAAESWVGDNDCSLVIPNGIDAAAFHVDRQESRLQLGRELPELGSFPFVLFLGRLHPKKRVDLLVEAFVQTALPDTKLVVAGPDERGLWSGIAARWQTNPCFRMNVVRLPLVEGALKRRLLASATLFVLPSEHENFGIAALESLATGTPVLLSPHVDFAHVDAPEGWIHVAALETAVWSDRLRALAVPTSVQADADALFTWVRQRHDWTNLAALLVRCYEWVLDGGRGTPPCNQPAHEDELLVNVEKESPCLT